MKHVTIFIIMLLITSIGALGQKFMTYDLSQEIKVAATVSNGTEYDDYLTKDGFHLKIGDSLQIGKPGSGAIVYDHIFIGRYTVGGMLLTGQPTRATTTNSQFEFGTIDRIWVYHMKASRQSPLYILVTIVNKQKGGSVRTIVDFEKAYSLGEIISNLAPLTRDQAIARLKEAKDLLDLEMMTKAEYDSLKAQLAPIIKQ